MAARKRDRRPTAAAEQNRTHPVPPPRTALMVRRRRKQLLFVFIVLSFILVLLLAFYRVPITNSSSKTTLSVYQRGLVKSDINYREIIEESGKVSENQTARHFGNPVLAYITPWNSKGYDMAKSFNSKFSHLSPVWYDLKSKGKKLVLEGRHNADVEWISELRTRGSSLILPRVVLEAFPAELLQKKQRSKAIDLIVKECKDMGYDGIVLESWSRWAAYGMLQDSDMRDMALQFVKELSIALHSVSSVENASQHLQLIYVISPPSSQDIAQHEFGPRDLDQLSDYVDGFSLMTYDFSSPGNPGPSAPLPWIHSSLELLLDGDLSHASTIFVGINFYGNDFALVQGHGGGAILGRDYVSLLERHRPIIHWEEKSKEHFFLYSDDNNVKHAVFYPTPLSISMRLDEARSWGAAISIWEIGQGLDYFFDLL